MSLRTTLLLPALLLSQLSAQDGPETVIRGTKQFKKSTVITGLAGPWEITWGPDNHLWVTERTGKQISRVDPATGQRKLAATLPEVAAPGGQDGLLGMALHPDLLKNKGNDSVYVFYTYIDTSLPADPTVTASSSIARRSGSCSATCANSYCFGGPQGRWVENYFFCGASATTCAS